MAVKTSPAGRLYEVDGKVFTWTTEDGATLTIPLRIKMKVVRTMPSGDLDVDGMFSIIEALIPGQIDVVDEMDSNDFTACFAAWNAEYALLAGAGLGESSGSPTSSASTVARSNTTGEPVSA